jgi:hypothetical protein
MGQEYLGELAPLTLLLLRLEALLGDLDGLLGVLDSMGAGIPAASNLALKLDNSRVSLFMTASDSASNSCSMRILSALSWSICFNKLFVICYNTVSFSSRKSKVARM